MQVESLLALRFFLQITKGTSHRPEVYLVNIANCWGWCLSVKGWDCYLALQAFLFAYSNKVFRLLVVHSTHTNDEHLEPFP